MSSVLDKYFSKFEACKDDSDLEELCEEFCDEMQFEFYMFAVCTVTSLSSPEISTLTNYPLEWLDGYLTGMAKHDPVVKYCFENTSSIRWDKLLTMDRYIDPKGAEIMKKAEAMGLVNGCSIPIKSPTGVIAILSFATCTDINIEKRMSDLEPNSRAFAAWLFDSYNRISSSKSDSTVGYKLTAREVECLFWACEGKTTWEISQIVGVTERTIVFHLTSATKKLGASNRQHAVAKAILCGLIKPSL